MARVRIGDLEARRRAPPHVRGSHPTIAMRLDDCRLLAPELGQASDDEVAQVRDALVELAWVLLTGSRS